MVIPSVDKGVWKRMLSYSARGSFNWDTPAGGQVGNNNKIIITTIIAKFCAHCRPGHELRVYPVLGHTGHLATPSRRHCYDTHSPGRKSWSSHLLQSHAPGRWQRVSVLSGLAPEPALVCTRDVM